MDATAINEISRLALEAAGAQKLTGTHIPGFLVGDKLIPTEHLLEGRLVGQAPEIDGRLLINDGIDLLPRDLPALARVSISDAHPYDLVGSVIA